MVVFLIVCLFKVRRETIRLSMQNIIQFTKRPEWPPKRHAMLYPNTRTTLVSHSAISSSLANKGLSSAELESALS